VLKATTQHSRNLATFVTIYKGTMYLLRRANSGKEREADSFVAGLLGGYMVFGRGSQSSVNQQIVIYVFARVALALAKLSVTKGWVPNPGDKTTNNGWPVFASLSWALVMYLFRWHPETIQPSLRNSMKYLYVPLSLTFSSKGDTNGG
jgi:Tim17/Tim22/Tim23/Pmp24 family